MQTKGLWLVKEEVKFPQVRMALLEIAQIIFWLSHTGGLEVQVKQDGSEERAVHKQNPEKSNASSCSSGRRRDKEKMWAAMEEDVEMYLKFKNLFPAFLFALQGQEKWVYHIPSLMLGLKE